MFRIDWSNPKTTLDKVEALVSANLGSIYDGLIVENDFLYVVTTEPMSSTQEDDIRTIIYNLNDVKQQISVVQQPAPSAFASKTINVGDVVKKLYKREHGIQSTLTSGANTVMFTIPYGWVKIIGLELIGGEVLDTVDFFVLDSTSGTYSGVPNYTLNQFGFNVNVTPGEYEEMCNYDADLYYGMQIKIIYNSVSNKTVGINFNLNEVKD